MVLPTDQAMPVPQVDNLKKRNPEAIEQIVILGLSSNCFGLKGGELFWVRGIYQQSQALKGRNFYHLARDSRPECCSRWAKQSSSS